MEAMSVANILKASSQSATKASFTKSITAARYIAIYGTRFYIQWHYSRQPVYWLPKGWIPWYGEWILSFPRAPMGSVSVQVWAMASGTILAMLVDAVTT